MQSADFDYELPANAIAQQPVEPRDAARLLVDRTAAGAATVQVEHRTVADLPDLVGPGDVVVVNSTRVLPARLRLRKPTGGDVEVLLLEPITADDAPVASPLAAGEWEALVRPSRRVAPGTVLRPATEAEAGPADGFAVTVGAELPGGRRVVRLSGTDVAGAVERVGQMPLPPYLTGELSDPDRYQTVFAERAGSVAAPTAGLHLTPAVLDGIRAAGADLRMVELWVGLATFRPITTADIDDHEMHRERYEVPTETWEACREADRVIAVGTTTVRALESVAATGQRRGATTLYLRPGSPVRVVDALLTNFHLPRSSLLVLLEAFVGPRWRELYRIALAEGYRFLSFGDAMFVARSGS